MAIKGPAQLHLTCQNIFCPQCVCRTSERASAELERQHLFPLAVRRFITLLLPPPPCGAPWSPRSRHKRSPTASSRSHPGLRGGQPRCKCRPGSPATKPSGPWPSGQVGPPGPGLPPAGRRFQVPPSGHQGPWPGGSQWPKCLPSGLADNLGCWLLIQSPRNCSELTPVHTPSTNPSNCRHRTTQESSNTGRLISFQQWISTRHWSSWCVTSHFLDPRMPSQWRIDAALFSY
jgi:hypothetical protein